MDYIVLTPSQLKKWRSSILLFAKKYGDRRITHKALRWLRNVKPGPFPEGTWMSVALEGRRLVGFICFGRYGMEEAFIVVHPSHRKKKVAETLLFHALEELDKVYTRVACDNVPSMKLCFSAGMIAFNLTTGPTGKPTLCFGGGEWSPEEFKKYMN
ncbi:GNAT family N-acetyltransferase [Kroppenstedtia pulmonis]|uniref:GNAT family N-acetyltransferase n=1 Tax=Kroppenstedtia pulmonis TaxID=1380685 RepID=A0A7D4B1W2_9BACL|nr:GNAT family N-acetyltransferase [Kroppenstedtia pulmonis]QKG83926.1 GNAT family N-acetyltransferase [Kroppenstedtia pulmonis]